MFRHAWFLILVAVAGAAEPNIVNAKLETRPAAGTLEREFRGILNGADQPVWIGWSAAAIERQGDCCCCGTRNCALEGKQHCIGSKTGPVQLEGSARIAVMVRAEAKQVGKVQVYSENCELDAGGLRVVWLTGVQPAESVNLLASLATNGPETVRDGTILAIAQHDAEAADRTLDRFSGASSPQPIREKAIFWLGAARGARGFPTLQRIVREDPSDQIREKAVFALFVSKTPQSDDAIIEVAHRDSSPHVRGQAFFWLGQKAGKKAEAALAGAIADDPDTEVKKKAVFALSQLPKDRGVPLLIETARTNRNHEVRKQAMFWLGQSQDARALAFFEEVLKK